MILPTTAEVRAWVQVPASAVSDEQMDVVIFAVGLNQASLKILTDTGKEGP